MDESASKRSRQIEFLNALEHRFKNGAKSCSSTETANDLHWDHDKCVGIMKSLEMMGKISALPSVIESFVVTPEGLEYLETGSPEYRILAFLKNNAGRATMKELSTESWMSIGVNVVLKNQWAKISAGVVELQPAGQQNENDLTCNQLKLVNESTSQVNLDTEVLKNLARRQLVTKVKKTIFTIAPTSEFSVDIAEIATDLTREMIITGSWKTASFKEYNFSAAGLPPAQRGSIHPLIQTSNMFRHILVEMGFEEMPTRRWVESSFWNFDSLFQPQSHPVRDSHDTFFMLEPKSCDLPAGRAVAGGAESEPFDDAIIQRAKKMHERGDHESIGWQYEWSSDEACKLIMRTHTTAISAQMLTRLGREYEKTGEFRTRRFFSVDRVFRNETLDATHLAEFHQVEGVVADKTVSLATMMGFIKTFFERIGIENVKFKPAYNPYTEPSMEIFGFHPLLNKWTEIGNSGLFRPEMLRILGIPDGVNVLGWGLSVERPTMISSNLRDIRQLFGPKARLDVF